MARHFSSLTDPEIVSLLNNGAVGVIPTDTVYGLVAKAGVEQAVAKLYQVKQRELSPGTMIGASIDDFSSVGLALEQLQLAERYWPAPLSVVVSADGVEPYLRQKRSDLPVRIPDYPELIGMLEQTGPLMTTSANAPGEPTSTSIQMATDYFGDEVDFYVDGGDLSGRPPSTIIGFDENNSVIVYREGAVKL